MNERLELTKLEKQPLLHEQVYEKMKSLLQSGRFQAGEKIPGSQKLAQMLDTHDATVHMALQKLSREGWLIRIPKKGTYVAHREEKLTRVGVYSGTSFNNVPFAHLVREMIKEELRQDGIEMDFWMDSRPTEEHNKPWEAMVKAAEQRRFQAFIGVETDLSLLQWQKKLPVPTAFLGGPPSLPNNATSDINQLVEISLRELARQGCRSVGLIAPVTGFNQFTDPDGSPNVWLEALQHFTNIARDLGLTLKNEWMRLFDNRTNGEEHERFGYEEFLKLWSQPKKPEGLLIPSDVSARGALMAIREKHVRVPEELKLVLQKNESLSLFCPVPATFAILSERDLARALIEQVQKQFRGETCERVSLPFKLVAHVNP